MIDTKLVLRQCPNKEHQSVLLYGFLLAIYNLIDTNQYGRLVRLFTDQQGFSYLVKSPRDMYNNYPMELAKRSITRSIKHAVDAFTDEFIRWYISDRPQQKDIMECIIEQCKKEYLTGIPAIDAYIKNVAVTLENQTDIYRTVSVYSSHIWHDIISCKYLK